MSKFTYTWQLWFNKAAKDLRTARALLDLNENDYLENAIFLCQQGAEKSIKGYLAKHKIRFKKTHDIKFLVDLLENLNPDLAESLRPAEILSTYAVAVRYPEEVEATEPLVIDRDLTEGAFKIASWAFKELTVQV